MSANAGFWDRIAEKYSRSPISDMAAYEKKLAKTQEYLKPDFDLLEFGCGTGGTAIYHAPNVANVLATDVSENMLAIGREKAREAGIGNIAFERAAVDELNFPDGMFDVVLGMSILHLVPQPAATVRDVYAWLKPGGVFVSSTACLEGPMRLLGLIAPIAQLFGAFPPVLKFFSEARLVKYLTSAGFQIEYQWKPEGGKAVFIIARKPL